ncbi:MAG: hypothetical protein EXR95_09350 [Gemmatimonadetes bacterium]|nr:hypothetical protein [Gemmatimonadota bacterium]
MGLGPGPAALLYRLPALIAGATSIVLAGFVNRLQLYGAAAPRALRPVAIGSILFASSYLLVHYDSEARGYAIAVACGLVALLAALRGSWTIGPWAHLYAVGAMLAVLAHPLAVHLLAGLVVWHVAEELGRRDPNGAAARLAAWQGPPIVFASGLWLVHLRRLEIGGGPRLELGARDLVRRAGRGPRAGSRTSLALLSLLAGCALQSNLIQLDVGRASRFDVLNKVEGVLNREGYAVQERRDTGALIQIASSWTTRAPFYDEAERGVTECRTRILVEGRRQGSDLFAVVVRAENSAQEGDTGVWKALTPTPMFRAHVRELSNALALEIDAGVRTR